MSEAALWAALPVPVFLFGADGAIRDASPAAEQLFSLSLRHMKGCELVRLLGGSGALREGIARLWRDGAPVSLANCPLQIGARPARAMVRLVLFGDLGLATVDPIEARIADQGGLRSAIGLAEMLGHEIKNPLAGISGAAQLLAASASAEDRPLATLIEDEVRRVAALIDRVEQFGQQTPPRRRAVNLHDGLERAKQAAGIGFAAHMQIAERYDPSLPEALVDPDQLQQILLNLLKNAAEASPAGGRIELRSFYDAGLRLGAVELPLHVEISDDGPGLPADLAAHVFEPFVSGRENGTGLGLALVAKLMADNGGLVSLRGGPGGACFRLSFARAA